jgi:glutathione S-transferase
VIALRAKNIEFDVTYIDLRDKPDWFLKISPHGKVPVLQVDGVALFESNAIAEYLDETVAPRLHPEDPLERARHRAWTDFIPDFAGALNGITYSHTREEMEKALAAAPAKLSRVDYALETLKKDGGPYFGGDRLCLVDAAYAPFLQRFKLADEILKTGLISQFPRIQAWSDALLANATITGAVAPNFLEEFYKNLERRETWAWQVKQAAQAAK